MKFHAADRGRSLRRGIKVLIDHPRLVFQMARALQWSTEKNGGKGLLAVQQSCRMALSCRFRQSCFDVPRRKVGPQKHALRPWSCGVAVHNWRIPTRLYKLLIIC